MRRTEFSKNRARQEQIGLREPQATGYVSCGGFYESRSS